MRLTLLRSNCGGGRTCPTINLTDRGTYVVQGYLVADVDLGGEVLAPGEAIVEVPSSLLPELADDMTARYAARRTDQGTVLVRGRSVVDAEALRELNLPGGEATVEIPISALPELEIAHAR
jgi:hypothetical protein